jgi:hypothetical protein
MRLDVVVLGAAFAAGLLWLWRRDQRRERVWREGLLDAAADLLGDCRRSVDALGFPVVDGRWRGLPVQLRLLLDGVALRRLPCLWLGVTLAEPLARSSVLDVLARAQNSEFYSPNDALEHRVHPPDDWPAHLQVKSSADPGDLAALTPPLQAFFADPRAKEALITPRGVRLVHQLGQARRGDYLLLRAARFDTDGAQPELVEALLERALALHAAAGQPPLRHAA